MGKLESTCPIIVAITLLLVYLLVTASAKTVNVSDDKSLKEYLCAGSIAPNTNLIITVPILDLNDESFCFVENTSDIVITASEDMLKYHSNVTVRCSVHVGCGFGFFNVTNLTIRSVSFETFGVVLPPKAVRYINGTGQFLYYNNTRSALIFNHCNNLALYNVFFFGDYDYRQKLNNFGIIGVNVCGHSKISSVVTGNHFYPNSKLLVYYTDSELGSLTTNCNLNITSPAVYTAQDQNEHYFNIQKYLNSKPQNMSISVIRGFALYITQQKFVVNAHINIKPGCKPIYDYSIMTVIILFVNSMTHSLVTFQGYPYEICVDDNQVMSRCNGTLTLTALEVVFYEIPSFEIFLKGAIISPLVIKNTSLILIHHGESSDRSASHGSAVLKIVKITRKISHQIVLENVYWCKNDINYFFPDNDSINYFRYLFHAQAMLQEIPDSDNGNLILNLNNIFMLNNKDEDDLPYPTPNGPMYLVNIQNVTMTGTNYFGHNDGGSVIIIESSNLTISGNLTVNDGYFFQGGGIRLDSTSTLYLKEPLSASFSNNNAVHGSAIYAPVTIDNAYIAGENEQSVSSIQILPIELYSVQNITGINIKLYFKNNTFGSAGNSLYAPLFSFFGNQTSPNFLFDANDWDHNYSQYAYTTLIDTVIQDTDMFDKYSSFSNGICFRPNRQKWKCAYIDSSFHDDLYGAGNPLPTIYAYPGETALSVVNLETGVYTIGGLDDNSYVNSTLIRSNSTLSFSFHCDYKYEDSDCDQVLVVTHIEVNVFSVPIMSVSNRPCPLGFNLTGYSCRCISLLETLNYVCDINTLLFSSPTGYWTGLNNATILIGSICPPNYCNRSFQTFYLDSSITELSCLNNRTGNLCGQCKENYSAVFGSDTCYSDCTDLYLLTLPVYALAGLLLVVVLFALRFTVATGTINGVIFYVNILSLVMDKLTERDQENTQTLQIIISLLNLDLGFPLCLYNGMTTAAKVAFQFVFPVYLWSIVVGMIISSKYSIKLSNIISNSSVQVLATLLYLSFAKLLRTVIDIISYSKMHLVTLTYISKSRYFGHITEAPVWYYNGEISYGQDVHVLLLTVAAVFIVLYLLPYTILTTFSYCFMRFRLINKFKPFVDAYGGPFKDKWRFWFGLRLWLTIVLFSVDGALQGTNTKSMLIFHFLIISTFIVFQVGIHPYKNRFIEITDVALMMNYWLIVVTYFLLESVFYTIYTLLLSSAILVLILTLLYRFWCWLYPIFSTKIKPKVLGWWFTNEHDNEHEDSEEEGMDLYFKAAEERVVDTY